MPRHGTASIRPVRRLLIMFLFVLLPLQSVWATAAAYCEHRSDAHQEHFGHHDGHHHATAGDAPSDSASAGADADASHCHGTCAALLTVHLILPTFTATQPTTGCADPGRLAPALSRPERPQWTSHA